MQFAIFLRPDRAARGSVLLFIPCSCLARMATTSDWSCWKSSLAVPLPRPRSWPGTSCWARRKSLFNRSTILKRLFRGAQQDVPGHERGLGHLAGHGGKAFSIDRRSCQSDGWTRPLPVASRIPSRQLLKSPACHRAAGSVEQRKGPNRRVIRVFIVAASPLIRAGLQSMLADSRFDIVGSAADLESLSGQLVDVEPDVVLVEAATYAQEELLSALEDAEVA